MKEWYDPVSLIRVPVVLVVAASLVSSIPFALPQPDLVWITIWRVHRRQPRPQRVRFCKQPMDMVDRCRLSARRPQRRNEHALFAKTTFSLFGPARPSACAAFSSLTPFVRRLFRGSAAAGCASASRSVGTTSHSASYPRRMFALRFCSLWMWFAFFWLADSVGFMLLALGVGGGLEDEPDATGMGFPFCVCMFEFELWWDVLGRLDDETPSSAIRSRVARDSESRRCGGIGMLKAEYSDIVGCSVEGQS